MTSKFLAPMLAIIPACICQSPSHPQGMVIPKPAAFACNLKAFTTQERAQYRKLSDRLMPAVLSEREKNDGYALELNTRSISVVEVAQWVELERKCCPFFSFQLDLRGEDGALWLSLTGREGVKQFIEVDFTGLRDKLPHRDTTR